MKTNLKRNRIFSTLTFLLCAAYSVSASALPQAPAPTGTLPVVYIETDGHAPIDQKEEYIPAKLYIEVPDGCDLPPLGDKTNPVELGIRGRGNSTWNYLKDKKPYKLKFDKKRQPLSMPSNKHFALLNYPYSNRYGFIYCPLAFRIGQIATPGEWIPRQEMVEVVLNGDYRGWYFLSETVRVGSGRVEIEEQPDDNQDPATIPAGWLVEIDNYYDENQINLGSRYGDELPALFTAKSPDPMNDLQREWATGYLSDITATLENSSPYDRVWEEYFDIAALVRYFLSQELVNNEDSFTGSTYFRKGSGKQLTMGPLWDIGDDFCWNKTHWNSFEGTRRKVWFKEIVRHPRFWEAVRNEWPSTKGNLLAAGLDQYIHDFAQRGKAASEMNNLRFPETTPEQSLHTCISFAKDLYRGNIEFIDNRLESEYRTYRLSFLTECETDDGQTCGHIRCNGFDYKEMTFFAGETPRIEVTPSPGHLLISLTHNGNEMAPTGEGDHIFELPPLCADGEIRAVFTTESLLIRPDADHKEDSIAQLLDTAGRLVATFHGTSPPGDIPPGIYLLRYGRQTTKTIIR